MIPAAWTALQAFLALLGIPKWLPAVLAAGAFGMAGSYFYGKHVAGQVCQEASLRTERDTLKRDLEAWKAADEIEAMLDKDADADRQELQKQVKDYEIQLRKRPPRNCTLDADDLRALDRVRGNGKH